MAGAHVFPEKTGHTGDSAMQNGSKGDSDQETRATVLASLQTPVSSSKEMCCPSWDGVSEKPLVVEGGGDILQPCNRAGKTSAIKSPKSELADLSLMPGIYMVGENRLL